MAHIILLNRVLHDELATVTIENIHLQTGSEPAVRIPIVREFLSTGADQKRGLSVLADASRGLYFSRNNDFVDDAFRAVHNLGVKASYLGDWIVYTVFR